MEKVISIKQAIALSQDLKQANKKVVLIGGCFDILHLGHIMFLKKAKSTGDVLLVLMESDQAIKKLKGENRPINAQTDRSVVLSALSFVDYVIMLSGILTNNDYDQLILSLKPAIIATTQGDSYLLQKRKQAESVQAKLVEVTAHIENQSTTRIAKLLHKEL